MTNIVLLSVSLLTNIQSSAIQVQGSNPVGVLISMHTVTEREVTGYKSRRKIIRSKTNDMVIANWLTTNFVRLQFVNPSQPPLPPDLNTNSQIRTEAMKAHERHH